MKKTFQQIRSILLEYKSDYKGWIHPKKNKIQVWTGHEPYHIQEIVNNPKTFGMTDKDFKKIFPYKGDMYDSVMRDISSGRIDSNSRLDGHMIENGWVKVGTYRTFIEFTAYNVSEGRKAMQMFFDKYPEIKYNDGGLYVDGLREIDFKSKQEMINYARTGKLIKQTDIGRTMSRFR